MIDHLFHFTDEPDLATLGITLPDDGDNNPIAYKHRVGSAPTGAFWGDIPLTLLDIKIVNAPATFDANGDIETPEVTAAGLWLATRTQSEIMQWRDNASLVTVTDDELAKADQPFVRYKNDAYPWGAMQGQVVPTFAGSHYPFGPDMGEAMLVA